MADDDDDYMSDKFIQSTGTYNPPSLIMKHSDKRKIALTKRKATADMNNLNKKKLQSIMEQEKREEGLSSAISIENKGFEIIMKMGYKPGQGIGKNKSGRSEPIPMNVKTNRLGLGTMNENSYIKKVNVQKINSPILDAIGTDEFRDRISSKKLEQLMEVDLIKSQIVCEQLDTNSGVNQPVESWYWPPITVSNENGDGSLESNEKKNNDGDCKGEEDMNHKTIGEIGEVNDHFGDSESLIEISTETKLDNITRYLRDLYAYCMWCGISYNDQNDLIDNCPGNARSYH